MAKRTREFSRNTSLESLLEHLGDILASAEKTAIEDFKKPELPVLLIHGCARSGTTLMMQILATTGLVAYPSNLISRFYRAPYIGALIQIMLTDPKFNFRNEFRELVDIRVDYESKLGKTQGLLSPNEFHYFWRRFFEYGEIQYLEDKDLVNIDTVQLLSEIAALENAFCKPVCMKGMLMNWNIDYLGKLIENALFIHVKRDVLFNAQSLLEARKEFYGDIKEWYSFKPPEYQSLVPEDPLTQVIGQVVYTNRAIEAGLKNIPAGRKLTVDYKYLCSNPADIIKQVLMLTSSGSEHSQKLLQFPVDKICNRDVCRLDEKTWKKLKMIRDNFDD